MAEDVAKNTAKKVGWPKIVSRRATRVSPWVEIVERGVEFTPGAKPDLYHAISQTDYVAIVALTPNGTIPIVRQYRPALENFTWELPAGTLDKDEQPADCCRRELLEETGFPAQTVHALGSYAPCTARLSNQIHTFFVETGPTTPPQSRPASRLNWFRLLNWPHLFWPENLCCNSILAPCCSRACTAIST